MSPLAVTRLAKAFAYVRSRSASDVYRAIRERVPASLYCRRMALVFELELIGPQPETTLPQGYSFRMAAVDEIAQLAPLTGATPETYALRVTAGDTCYGLFEVERLMTILWVHRGSCFVRGLGFSQTAGDNDAYVYWIYTVPAGRKRGFYRVALQKTAELLAVGGIRKITQLVESGNMPVLRTLPRLGYVHTGTILHRRFLGVKTTTVEDVRNGIHHRSFYVFSPRSLLVI